MFSNLLFLYILLPVSVLIYHLMPDMRRKNLALLIMSLVFCALVHPFSALLMTALTFMNFHMGLRVDGQDRSTLILPVALNVGAMVLLPYLEFALEGFHLHFPAALSVIGMAFYGLSAVSYLADVYRGYADPEENLINLMLYLQMFPKLLGGPIVRYEQIQNQLEARKHHPRALFEGFQRFLFGLAKKVVLADTCGRLLDELNVSGGDTTLVGVWYGAVLVLFGVYYAFSGYSDMAIGLGRIFGFRFCENFDRPYMCLSVADFCEHWHMSLGQFFRDYVYAPLGGKELGKSREMVNIFIVCLLAGLWHGVGLNFLLWGIYLFVIIALERYLLPYLENLPDWVSHGLTIWFLLVGWIIFSHGDLEGLRLAFQATLGFGGMGVEGLGMQILRSVPFLTVCFLGCTYLPVYVSRMFAGVCGMGQRRRRPGEVTVLRLCYLMVTVTVMVLLLWISTAVMVGNLGAGI